MWAAKGVLLWLLQRPYLRWLPLPYPATSSVEKWLCHAQSMVWENVCIFAKDLDFGRLSARM